MIYQTSTENLALFAKELSFTAEYIPTEQYWYIVVRNEQEFYLLKKLWEENKCEPHIN